eukprot:1015993-Pelagomonas_calceolata.AAC.2
MAEERMEYAREAAAPDLGGTLMPTHCQITNGLRVCVRVCICTDECPSYFDEIPQSHMDTLTTPWLPVTCSPLQHSPNRQIFRRGTGVASSTAATISNIVIVLFCTKIFTCKQCAPA